jgi:putative transcriptional regulator
MGEVTPRSLINGLKEVYAHKQGQVKLESVTVTVPDVDVRAIRDTLKLSQDTFAKRYGLSLATIRNWEHGARKPEGPARVLLNLIQRQPDLVAQEVKKMRNTQEDGANYSSI